MSCIKLVLLQPSILCLYASRDTAIMSWNGREVGGEFWDAALNEVKLLSKWQRTFLDASSQTCDLLALYIGLEYNSPTDADKVVLQLSMQVQHPVFDNEPPL